LLRSQASSLLIDSPPPSSDGDPVGRPAAGLHRSSAVAELRARIRRYNCELDPAGPTFGAALVLMAGTAYGQNVDLVARKMGLDRALVARCARRLIDNGVWEAGRTLAEWAPEDPASGSFWNDVAVAEGKMCRRSRPDGSLEWAPAGFWNKGFHFLDPDAENRLGNLYFDSTPPPADPPGSSAAANSPDSGKPALDHATGGSLPADRSWQPQVPEGDSEQETVELPLSPPTGDVPPLHHVFRDAVWIG
jgi:hypothetical protein